MAADQYVRVGSGGCCALLQARVKGIGGEGVDALGFDAACGRDEVFRGLVLALIIEPASKLDSLRALEEVGVPAESYPTVNRRLGE